MRQTFVVCYDISDPKRLRKVFKKMRGYGDPLQLSVFQCDLSPRELIELRRDLSRIIHHTEDQVLFVDLGPADGRGAGAITSLGRPYAGPSRSPIIV